ncbi:hypothetical protein NEUTE1DRAFT_93913, partial [Neurospora tetrasperma FGSC 2508]
VVLSLVQRIFFLLSSRYGWPSTVHYSTLCGRHTVKRVAFGIWKCHGQGYAKLLSGGAYLPA